MSADQRRQLRQLQNLESISSFAQCNILTCRFLYDEFATSKNFLIQQSMELPEPTKPLKFKFNMHEPHVSTLNLHEDIPGATWAIPNPPGFYLPETLKLGQNCRAVREAKAKRRLMAEANNDMNLHAAAPPSATVAAAAAASSSDSSTSSPPSLAEWVLDKLLDVDLQILMESQHVINAWDEGTHFSVLRTEGDGNCLCHAAMLSVYGFLDMDGDLRDAIYWEMNSDARRPLYLERYIQDQAREIGSAAQESDKTNPFASAAATSTASSTSATLASSLLSPAGAGPIASLDEADRKNLEKEFAQSIERLSNIKAYLDAIHVVSNRRKRDVPKRTKIER